ncbi:hypothetical protein [Burkholderia cenocepacia]|uniref:hypothetical protein n=1 Tax=Burkholderia cenocepacia TaxID=95486 RepID=UPI00209B2EDF|nr:hypothetical protein [Burkholderia cenocepacia]
MDYTTSPDYGVAANGQRLHQDAKSPATVISRRDLNMLIWSLMEVLKAAGISGKEFSPGDPDSYQRFLRSLRRLFADAPATAAAIEALTDGQVAGLIGFPTRAEMDANLAYPDNTIALVTNDADPANNSYFRKVGESGTGSWVMSDYPSQATIEDLQNRLATAESQTVVLQVADVDGFVFVQMLQDGTLETPGLRLGPRVLANDTFGMESGTEAALRMVDADGFWIDVVGDDGKLPGALETGRADGVRVVDSEGFYVELLDPAGNAIGHGRVDRDNEVYGARNSRNLALSAAVKSTLNSIVCPWAWDYNHIAFYGQSLEASYETWPALSRVSRYASNVMVGGSVRPVTDTGAFDPVGGAIQRSSRSLPLFKMSRPAHCCRMPRSQRCRVEIWPVGSRRPWVPSILRSACTISVSASWTMPAGTSSRRLLVLAAVPSRRFRKAQNRICGGAWLVPSSWRVTMRRPLARPTGSAHSSGFKASGTTIRLSGGTRRKRATKQSWRNSEEISKPIAWPGSLLRMCSLRSLRIRLALAIPATKMTLPSVWPNGSSVWRIQGAISLRPCIHSPIRTAIWTQTDRAGSGSSSERSCIGSSRCGKTGGRYLRVVRS